MTVPSIRATGPWVPGQVADLLRWLERTREHPLAASCVVHSELTIQPFADETAV